MVDAITEKITPSRRQLLKILGLSAATAVTSGAFILDKLFSRPTTEQEQAEKAMRGRALTTYKVVGEPVAVRRLPYIEGKNDPPTNFEEIPLGTMVKGMIWRDGVWLAIKYEKDDRTLIGFVSKDYLEEVKTTPTYSR